MRPVLLPLALALFLSATPSGTRAAEPATANEYPTEARTDYVFACMNVNGGTQDALHRCSCAIDVIATILPYHDYEEADTVLRMRQVGGGYLTQTFRVQQSNQLVDRLQAAQAEADVRCF